MATTAVVRRVTEMEAERQSLMRGRLAGGQMHRFLSKAASARGNVTF